MIYSHLEDAIQNWQHKVRTETDNQHFRAIPFLADLCGVRKSNFYKWLEGGRDGTKMGLTDFIKIVTATKDLTLIDTLKKEIQEQIKLTGVK